LSHHHLSALLLMMSNRNSQSDSTDVLRDTMNEIVIGTRQSYRRRILHERPVNRRTTHEHADHTTNTTTPAKRKREAGTPCILRLSLQVTSSLSKVWIGQTSLSVLVDYLLYTRELFPLSVAEITANLGSTSGIYSTPRMQRKLKSASDQRRKFFEAWNSDSTSYLLQRSSSAMITIGPSYGRGTESYLLDLRGLLTEPLESHYNTTPPSHVLARKLLPKMMEANLGLPRSNSASFRLFVSLWVSSEQEACWIETAASGSTHDTGSNWIPRSGRALPTLQELRPQQAGRNPKRRLMAISLRHGSGSDDHHEGEFLEGMMADDSILDTFNAGVDQGQWLCLPQAIRGFRV
jgi:hypothetical protein